MIVPAEEIIIINISNSHENAVLVVSVVDPISGEYPKWNMDSKKATGLIKNENIFSRAGSLTIEAIQARL